MGAGFFALPVIGLQIIHQLEKFVPGGLQLHGNLVGIQSSSTESL